jgi:hypothetical protein
MCVTLFTNEAMHTDIVHAYWDLAVETRVFSGENWYR